MTCMTRCVITSKPVNAYCRDAITSHIHARIVHLYARIHLYTNLYKSYFSYMSLPLRTDTYAFPDTVM